MQLVPTRFPSRVCRAYTGMESTTLCARFPAARVELVMEPQTRTFHDRLGLDVPLNASVLPPPTVRTMPSTNDSHSSTQVSSVLRPESFQRSEFLWPVKTLADNYQLVDLTSLTDHVQWHHESPISSLLESSWIEVPGRGGSWIRLREVATWGGGLVFFPWANHRRLQFQGKLEMIMEFRNFTVTGEPCTIILRPEDGLVWCPAKYMWPACVVCGKFLFPEGPHRCSEKHLKKTKSWINNLRALHDVYSMRSFFARGFVQKNLHGLTDRG